MLPTATVAGGTLAAMDGKILDAASLDVKANGSNTATAAVEAGITIAGLADSGANATAEVTSAAKVEARIGAPGSVTAPGAAVLVNAVSVNTATATANVWFP